MKKTHSFHKGFTLIELLVVVAIIALLAATILASLGSARTKAKNTKITSELSSFRAQMELFYNSNGFSYVGSGVTTNTSCGTDSFNTGIDNAKNLVQGIANDITGNPTNYYYMACAANPTSWAVSADLSQTQNAWCVDSTGVSKAAVDSLGNPTNSPFNSIGSNPYHCL